MIALQLDNSRRCLSPIIAARKSVICSNCYVGMNVSRTISSMGPFVILDWDKLIFLKKIGKKNYLCIQLHGGGGVRGPTCHWKPQGLQ